MTITYYLTRAIVGAAIVAVLALLLFKQCGDEDNNIRARLKELEQRHKQDSIAYDRDLSRLQDSIDRAAQERQLQVAVLKEKDKKLAQSETTINRLISIIRNAPTNPDSSFVLVSKDYKKACDSLPGEIEKQRAIMADKDTAINSLVNLLGYEIDIRDSVIRVNDNYIGTLNTTIAQQKGLIEAALRAGEQRGMLLGGVGIMGNQIDILYGTSVKLAYQSKKGKQYQVAMHITKPGLYYEVSVLVPLIK